MKAVPNIISIFRICLVPVFIAVYFYDTNDIKLFPTLIYAVAGASDILDGYLARKYKASSGLGLILDPLGDKLMSVSVMACMAIDGIIPIWAVLVAGGKEILMAIGGFVVHKVAHAEVMPANTIGKAAVTVYFLVCVSLMLFRSIPSNAATALISTAIALTILSLLSYLNKFIILMRNRNKDKSKEGSAED